MALIIQNVLAKMEQIIEQVEATLPRNFPGDVAEAIFDGMRSTKERMS